MVNITNIGGIKLLYSNIFNNNIQINEIDLNDKIFLKKNIIIATLPIFRINYNNKIKTYSVESYKNNDINYNKFYDLNKICYIYELNNTDTIRGVITSIDYNENIIFYYMKRSTVMSDNYYELYITDNNNDLFKNKRRILVDLLMNINSPNRCDEKLIKLLNIK